VTYFAQLTDQANAVVVGILSNFVELCLWNVAQSDNQTVEEAIQTFNSSVDVDSIFSVNITIIIDELISMVCPGQPACSGRGQCLNSTCICDAGSLSCNVLPLNNNNDNNYKFLK